MHMNCKPRLLLHTLALTLGLATMLPANASVVIANTRVVYKAEDRETTIKLNNAGRAPALTQSWIDAGNPKASPSDSNAPFTVTPPVARIDPGKAQTLRIFYTGEPLPKDRESVFWLNVLEVPPKATGADAEHNKLQMAFRSRIKLFFRPTGLSGTPELAAQQVEWRLVRDGKQVAVEGRNASAFHVTVSALSLVGDGGTVQAKEGGMIGPGETKRFSLTGATPSAPPSSVHYETINDYGGATKSEAALHASSSAGTD
ncbi:MAG: fimbrial biogenesis chaperone [Stenotrophomonas sp.]|uniref:fimbrial biogenesis chaperone n=1 Tax=Stenotrophomonas sp. TaxID=69392 RepID=UPI003D6CEB3B